MVLFGSERASRRLAKVARLTPTDMLHLILLEKQFFLWGALARL